MKKIIREIYIHIKNNAKYWSYKSTVARNGTASDLYIVEFPKSGITWLSTIIANSQLIENEVPLIATFYNLERIIPDIHVSRNIERHNGIFTAGRIIKSHARYNPFYRHVVYIVRNPFSVMQSYHKYAINNKFFVGSISEFIRDEHYGIDSWVKHVNSWVNPKREPKFHLVKYEDLHQRPLQTVSCLFKSLGFELSIENLEKAIERSSFENMKESAGHYQVNSPSRSYNFVRKGSLKSEDFSIEDMDLIKEKCHSLLVTLYPEYLEEKT